MALVPAYSTSRDYDALSQYLADVPAALISCTLVSPLRVATVMHQTNLAGRHLPLRRTLRNIYREEGILGYFKGNFTSFLYSTTAQGASLAIIRGLFQFLRRRYLSYLAAISAPFVATAAFYPLDTIATRLSVQSEDARRGEITAYRGTIHGLFKIYRDEGLAGLYSGVVPAMLGAVTTEAVSLPCYNVANAIQLNLLPTQQNDDPLADLAPSVLAAVVGAAVAYPFTTVSRRLQIQYAQFELRPNKYKGLLHCIESIWREEGILGFYNGLSGHLLLVAFNTAIMRLVSVGVTNAFSYLLQKLGDALAETNTAAIV